MTFADGTLLKSSDRPEVWLIKGGQRHWIPSPDIFNADGFSWAAILVVSDAEIAAIPQGPDVPLYTTWITPGPNDPILPGQSQLPTVQYAGVSYKRWRSSGGGHTIYGRAQYVTQTGLISGSTVTMNSVMFTGYHSGTSALITNSNNIVVYSSPVFRVGVNPQGFSGQTVVSVNAWSFTVPAEIADQAQGFAIALSESPDNLQQIMEKSLGSVVTTITPLITAIGGLLTGSKSTPPKSGTQSAANSLTSTTTTSESALRKGWEEKTASPV